MRSADLFCGSGGLSLGAWEACRAIHKRFVPILAVDDDPDCIGVYRRNFVCKYPICENIGHLLDGKIGARPTSNEMRLLRKIRRLNLCLAGPPCQGNSDLNNHTRRKDPRNALYGRVARFVELTTPDHTIIENVPTAIHGREGAVQTSRDVIRDLGYSVDDAIVELSSIGVPQKRKRHILVASIRKRVSVSHIVKKFSVDRDRTVWWAIRDIEDEPDGTIFARSSKCSEENLKRIKYLHERHIFDLPNHLRPPCHRSNHHTYKSMYGRLRRDEPAQTITSGFGSPGQGRFVHPTRLRVLTPHEAARIQFFPDFFDFSSVRHRQSLAEMIGNAAPMKLSYALCLELLT